MNPSIGTTRKSGIKYYRIQWPREGKAKEKYFRTMPDARNFLAKMQRDFPTFL